MTKKPKPPADLSPEAANLWRRINSECEMDAAGLLLLDSVAQQWDRVRQARAIIAREGLVLQERTAAGDLKHRAHPACAIENNAAAAMMRGWRLLGFDQNPPGVE